jgi:hypothetical protein
MTAKQFSALLVELNACYEAQEWAKDKSLAVVWKTCKRGDWLLWLCGKMADKPHWPTHKEVVLAACDCAELALKHVPEGENRPRKCIEVVRAWAAGTATLDEVRTARRAAYAAYAAYAADAAYAAATYAADDADDAATYAAYAAAYAANAAYAADYFADAAASAADAYAARTKTLSKGAVLVRKRLKIARISKSRGTK